MRYVQMCMCIYVPRPVGTCTREEKNPLAMHTVYIDCPSQAVGEMACKFKLLLPVQCQKVGSGFRIIYYSLHGRIKRTGSHCKMLNKQGHG